MTTLNLDIVDTLELKPIPPFSFTRTVRKSTRFGADWFLFTPFESYEQDALFTGLRLESGDEVGLRFVSEGTVYAPSIKVDIYAKKKKELNVAEIKEVVVSAIGANVDVRGFYALARSKPVLVDAVNEYFGMRVTTIPDLFTDLMFAITLQRASYGRSTQMFKCMVERYGTRLQFADKEVIIPPAPQKVDRISQTELRTNCKLGYRAEYIKEAANSIAKELVPSFNTLAKMSFEEAKNTLKVIKGVGTYSTEVVLPHPALPLDSWSTKIFSQVFQLSDRDIDSLKAYVEKRFHPWERYVYEYIVNYVDV